MAARSVSLCISLPTTRYAKHGNAVPSEGARDRRYVVAFRDVVSWHTIWLMEMSTPYWWSPPPVARAQCSKAFCWRLTNHHRAPSPLAALEVVCHDDNNNDGSALLYWWRKQQWLKEAPMEIVPMLTQMPMPADIRNRGFSRLLATWYAVKWCSHTRGGRHYHPLADW